MDCFKLLETNQVDCFILHNEFDKRYLTNFSGSSCQVIIKKMEFTLLLMEDIKHKLK